MSDMHLQPVTECVSDIGQPWEAPASFQPSSATLPLRPLPPRRTHVTQKIKIPGRTLYISVHDDPAPAELFLRVKGIGCTAEIISLYDVLTRLASIALQHGAPLAAIGEMLLGAKVEPAGPVSNHPHIRNCTSLPDLIGRHLLIEYCARPGLAHATDSSTITL